MFVSDKELKKPLKKRSDSKSSIKKSVQSCGQSSPCISLSSTSNTSDLSSSSDIVHVAKIERQKRFDERITIEKSITIQAWWRCRSTYRRFWKTFSNKFHENVTNIEKLYILFSTKIPTFSVPYSNIIEILMQSRLLQDNTRNMTIYEKLLSPSIRQVKLEENILFRLLGSSLQERYVEAILINVSTNITLGIKRQIPEKNLSICFNLFVDIVNFYYSTDGSCCSWPASISPNFFSTCVLSYLSLMSSIILRSCSIQEKTGYLTSNEIEWFYLHNGGPFLDVFYSDILDKIHELIIQRMWLKEPQFLMEIFCTPCLFLTMKMKLLNIIAECTFRPYFSSKTIELRFLDDFEDSTAEGISKSHWKIGNFVDLLTSCNLSSLPEALLIEVLRFVKDSLSKVDFPGIFQGRSGVFALSRKHASNTQTIVQFPNLLRVQLYSLYQFSFLQFLYEKSLKGIPSSLSPSSDADVYSVINNCLSSTGLSLVSLAMDKDQKDSSSSFRWIKSVFSSMSSSSQLFRRSTKVMRSIANNPEMLPWTNPSENPIWRIILDLWSFLFTTGVLLPMESFCWRSLSKLTYSTDIVLKVWILWNGMIPPSYFYDWNGRSPMLHPDGYFAIVGVLVALYKMTLLSMDDQDFFEKEFPLPLHQVALLLPEINMLLYKIISNDPESVLRASAPGLTFLLSASEFKKDDKDSSESSSIFDWLWQSKTSLKSSSSKKSKVADLFLSSISLCMSSILRDLYLRWARRPFIPPSVWDISSLKSFQSLLMSPHDTTTTSSTSSSTTSSTTSSTASPTLPPLAQCILLMSPWSLKFFQRMSWFRQSLDNERKSIQGTNDPWALSRGAFRSQGTMVTIRRRYMLEDGLQTMKSLKPTELKDRIVINYLNDWGEREAGIDAGGLFKDFLTSISHSIFYGSYGLFCSTTSGLLYPNPDVYLLFDDEATVDSFYEFVGVILGKSLYENITIQPLFAHFFLSFMHGKYDFTHMLEDMATLDAEIHKNLMFLKNYEGCVDDLSLTFSVVLDKLGKNEEVNLIPNGSSIAVTAENRFRYIHTVAKFYIHDRIRRQSQSIFRGLYKIINPDMLTMFCAPELQLLISGCDLPLSIVDWKDHTSYEGYTSFDPVIQRFWTVVEEMEANDRSLLLKFVTSCDRAPSMGFSSLTPRFTIHKLTTVDDSHLPLASTCFNILKLPAYSTKKILKERLIYAIRSNTGFELS